MSSLLYLLTKYGTIYLTGTLQGSMGSTPELGIRKQDVDLDKGILLLNETKNNKQRYVVMGDDLRQLMNAYADKCFYLLGIRTTFSPMQTAAGCRKIRSMKNTGNSCTGQASHIQGMGMAQGCMTGAIIWRSIPLSR